MLVLLVVCCSFSLSAAPMVRVISIKDSRTVVVDDRGVAAEVTLAQVVIPPAEEEAAAAYLRKTLVNSWVMMERDERGAYLYRSPDALFVNGALATRAYAQSGAEMIFLGEVSPGPRVVEKQVAVVKRAAPVRRRRR